jgi:hypothetical protein
MEETTVELRRWQGLERPIVAHSLKALAAFLGLFVLLARTGQIQASPRWVALAIFGLLISLVLGWRWFRDTLATVQSLILLAVIYLLGVGIAAAVVRLARQDLLDLKQPKASLWRRRERVQPDELTRTIEHQF